MEKLHQFLDLTHSLHSEIPFWDETNSFKVDIVDDYESGFRTQKMTTDCGVGTHIDSPAACFPNGYSVDRIPIESLIVVCRTINISHKADSDTKLSLSDIKHFEEKFGPIFLNQFILIATGWGQRWSDPVAYRNDYRFPSISVEAARYLADKRIAGVGIDTLSPDAGGKEFPVHRIFLERNIYIVENVALATSMPPNASVIILPLKGQRLTEAPVRLIGMI